MPIKFQYNKTALNTLQKQLKMRQKALPTLQNKESALRLEVRKAKDKSEKLLRDLEEAERRYDYLAPLWNEFEPGLVSIVDIDLVTVKVAGVKCPELKSIRYEISPFNTFIKPAWYIDGVAILKGTVQARDRVRGLQGEAPHPGFPEEEDHAEGESVREGADPGVPGGHPQDQALHGGRGEPEQGLVQDRQAAPR